MAGSHSQHPIIVVGAGICGVSTAIWLQRYGHDVVLIDKSDPGQAASYGNAGLIAQWAVSPTATPGLMTAAPKMLLDPNGALFAKWSYLPRMIPWLVQFLANSRHDRATRNAHAIMPLVTDALDQHRSLTAGTGVDQWIRDSKMRYIYPDLRDYENDAFSWGLKRAAGFSPRVVTGAEIYDLEPMIGPNIRCLVELDGQGHITNPGQYVAELARYFEREGGKFIKTEVRDFKRDGGRISRVLTTDGDIDCDRVVITSGIWSRPLMDRLGLSVPLETERGYHVIFKNPNQMPLHPMMAAGKFAITPMSMGLRCAGTVELGGTELGPSQGPIALIRRFVANAFPDLTFEDTEEWMGFRPTTPDSLPLIGQLGNSGIYTCFGHQHVGLTAGPKSGRMVADMMTGRHSNLDLTPYNPARFTAR